MPQSKPQSIMPEALVTSKMDGFKQKNCKTHYSRSNKCDIT